MPDMNKNFSWMLCNLLKENDIYVTLCIDVAGVLACNQLYHWPEPG